LDAHVDIGNRRIGRLERDQLHRHPRPLRHEGGQPRREPPVAQRAARGHAQAALSLAVEPRKRVERGAEFGQQCVAGVGELEAWIEAADQTRAVVLFEPAHAVADRALCQAQLGRGAREAQVARHRLEGDQFGKRRQAAHRTIVPGP
jgi:hypothetical protein